jgi:hypothetical protein
MSALSIPVPLLAALLLAALVAGGSTAAQAAERAPRVQTLTLRTSLGALDANDERALRARGVAPHGARIYVRFYRGTKHLFTRKTTTRGSDDRYSAFHRITRTGGYRIRVTAITRSGARLKVSAKLDYAPVAEAPSAPDPASGGGGGSTGG